MGKADDLTGRVFNNVQIATVENRGGYVYVVVEIHLRRMDLI